MSVNKPNLSIPLISEPSLSIIYLTEDSCLVICKLIGYEEINFNIVTGDLKLKLLFGNLTINEYSLEDQKAIQVYADKDNHLFCRTNFDLKFNLINFKSFLTNCDQNLSAFNNYTVKEINRLKLLNSNGCFMLLFVERNRDPLHLKYCHLTGKIVETLNWIKLEQKDQIVLREQWKDYLVNNLEDQFKQKEETANKRSNIVMICGGKNSGKSTLIKHLINRQLNNLKDEQNRKIYYLDLDPGQSEFTNSGQISLIQIDKPILFPTYVNVSKFKDQIVFSCSVTSTNMEDVGNLYSENLAYLWTKIQQFIQPNDLLFVNTMGFVRIIGFMMLIDAIKLIKPTFLIEIRFDLPENVKNLYDINYPIDLTAKNVLTTKGWLQFDTDRLRLKYNYLKLTNQYGLFNPKNSKLKRINSQLVYLSLIDSLIERPLSHLQPYTIKFEDVKIHLAIENQPEQRLLLDILNCSWIQLCRIEEQQINSTSTDHFEIIKIFGPNQCLGNAFIRNIDAKNRLFYIITPENLNTIKQVNCFVKPSSINAPKEVFISQLVHSKVQPLYIDVNF